MKIDDLDRAEALIRMPEYLKDLDTLNRLRKKSSLSTIQKKTRELEKKYNLLMILTPELVETIKNPVVTGFTPDGKFISHEMMEKRFPTKIEARRQLELKRIFTKPSRHVYVKIDLNKSKDENLFLVSHDYDMWQKALKQLEKPKPEERKTELNYSSWVVHDMEHKDGIKNMSEIARRLSGVEGSARGKLRPYLQSVIRARDRANKIIEHIRQEAINFKPTKTMTTREIVQEAIKKLTIS